MRIGIGALLGILLLTAGVPSRAENPLEDIYKGQELFSILNSENRYLKYYAMGYITGVAFIYDDLGTVCFDKDEVEHLELTACVFEYFKDHPKQKKNFSSTVIRLALEEVYPCGQ